MGDVEKQLDQLHKVFESYKADIISINNEVIVWDNSEDKNPDLLAANIKAEVKNAAEISVSINENNDYLVELEFKPITVALLLKTH